MKSGDQIDKMIVSAFAPPLHDWAHGGISSCVSRESSAAWY
jgi:hypothetical protein